MLNLPSVTSNGWTGEQFIRALTKENFNLDLWTIDTLKQRGFKSTNGITYDPAVINNGQVHQGKIHEQAKSSGYIRPPAADLAPLLRSAVSDQEIRVTGIHRLIIMHEPIMDSEGHARLLCIMHPSLVVGALSTIKWRGPKTRWPERCGFVFLKSANKN